MLHEKNKKKPIGVVSLKRGDRKFTLVKFKKIVENTFLRSSWCIPVPLRQEILCEKILTSGIFPEYQIKVFNFNGKLLRELRILKRGLGPTEVKDWGLNAMWVMKNGNILFMDGLDYLKELNTKTFEIKTIVKISNEIKDYLSKYDFGGKPGGIVLETKNGITITTLTPESCIASLLKYLELCVNIT